MVKKMIEQDDVRNPNPTSTYRGTLMSAINAVIFYKNMGNSIRAIEALGTLRGLLIPPVREEVKPIWDEYRAALDRVFKTRGVDLEDTKTKMRAASLKTIKIYVDPIIEQTINALYKHKFLNADWGSRPDNPRGGSFE